MPRAPSPGPSDSDSDQNSASEVEEEFEVDAILAERETKRGGKPVTEFLVAWKPTNGQKWDDTWEPEENLQNVRLISAFAKDSIDSDRGLSRWN